MPSRAVSLSFSAIVSMQPEKSNLTRKANEKEKKLPPPSPQK
jgi:hypothetical protein